MNIGKAIAIFKDINNSEYSEFDKALAIYMVMNMETHNSVTKASMLEVIKWLWDRHYEINVADDVGGGTE